MHFFLLFDVDCFAWLATLKRKHVIENYPLAGSYVDGIRCERVSGKPIPLKWIYNLLHYFSLVFSIFFSKLYILFYSIHFVTSTVFQQCFFLLLFHLMSFNNYCLLPFDMLFCYLNAPST